MNDARDAAARWLEHAAEEDAMAEYEEGRGMFGGVFRARAQISRDTARSIELTERTGVDHCACHLTPASLHRPRTLR